MAAFDPLQSLARRYSGASLTYQFSSIIGGSLTPIIAIALFQQFGSSIPISVYVATSLLVCTAAAFISRETRGVELAETAAA